MSVMGSWFSSIVSKCLSLILNWSQAEIQSGNMALKNELEIAILHAVDKGDVETLQEMSVENRFMFKEAVEHLKSSNPLLHRAAAKCRTKVIEFLLDLGLDPGDTDSSGMTALHIACMSKGSLGTECVKLLLSCYQDVDKRDNWGRTSLIKALVFRNLTAAQMLLEKGANPNATDIYGMTPLATAIDYNLMEMMHCLVSYGADINLITQHPCRISGPPLYQAIHNRNLTMVQELLALGANTQPCLQDYIVASPVSQQNRIPYLNFQTAHTPPSTTLPHQQLLQHNTAVAHAISELVSRGDENVIDSLSIDILMAVLAAHGHSLGSSQEVLVRVLLNANPKSFACLLHKLQICSSCCSEEMTAAILASQDSLNATVNIQQLTQRLKKPPRIISSLQNQARRSARRALMASKRNVVWASQRIQCPPALKSLILLKDVDRAFGQCS